MTIRRQSSFNIPLALLLAVVLAACERPDPTPGPPGGNSTEQGAADVWFEDVTRRAGLADARHSTGASGKKWMPESFGPGVGFIDYDGDGWQDILYVGGGGLPTDSSQDVRALRLYRNRGDGSFTEVTGEAGLDDVRAYGMGVTVADYDNDGDDDFYFTTLNRNRLFRNDHGEFTDVTADAAVGGGDRWSTCSIFFDADRDGYLDLYVCNYVTWSPATDIFCTPDGTTKVYCTPQQYDGVHGRFYVNQGDGTFRERTDEAGFAGVPGKSLGVAGFDYNRDGWTDLVVANDTERDLLFTNKGDGTFEEHGMRSGVAYDGAGRATGGMGIDAGVVDSSGQPTIFIGNFAKERIGVFRHHSDGIFRYESSASRIGHPSLLTLAFGLFLFDFDLDTDLDLFVANGHVQPLMADRQDAISYEQAPQLFVNRGDGTFTEGASTGALTRRYVARGAAYADIDHDGDPDIVVTENGGPMHLLVNRRIRSNFFRKGNQKVESAEGTANFLRVTLVGTDSNADGVGARITVRIDDHTMERYLDTGSSYLSSSELTATFGLGDAEQIDELTVEWPSGNESHFQDVKANQRLKIVEGSRVLSFASDA